jgi:integrase
LAHNQITHDLVLPWIAKNGEPLRLPVLPWLQRAIDELPPSADMVFFPGPDGKPLSGKRIADILREACLAIDLGPKIVDDSGRPKGLCGHGLRKLMATRLAELCGCSELQIMSVLGQRDPRSAKIYTEGASRNRMAEDALFTLVAKLAEQEQAGTTVLPTPLSALPTHLQHFGNKGK